MKRACLLIALVCLGCKHDLDKLKARRGELRDAGNGGGAGSSGGGSGSGSDDAGAIPPDGGASGSGAAGSSAGSGGIGSCASDCDELGMAAETLGLRNCCRGTTNLECGLTFGEGALCLPQGVPGQPNADCPDVRAAGLTLDGCCRPDGRCGALADNVGLGCVARDELRPVLGATMSNPIACEFSCGDDADCAGVPGGHVCAESEDHTTRYCANDCQRDRDCGAGRICGLSNDVGEDRVLAICREPIGPGEPGEFCSAANDCVHGVCTRADTGGVCAELCVNTPDCDVPALCGNANIPAPSETRSDEFGVCLR